MHSMISLLEAITFIENNLKGELSVADVATSAYVSVPHLQRMFANVFQCSVGDYATKRKLCAAAQDLLATTLTITDVAFIYGYSGSEAFSRAFKRQFLKTPSAFRKQNRFVDLYPRLVLNPNKEHGGNGMTRKYDLTEIGAKILAAKGTYILNVDVDNMDSINKEKGYDMGDLVLATTAARLERSISPEMDFFRIGGDEFVVLTGSDDFACAEAVAQSIVALAEEEVGKDASLFHFSLSVGIAKISADVADPKTALEQSDAAMMVAKRKGKNGYASQ